MTNVVRPVTSTPVPIASKPGEAAVAPGSLPQEKAALLIGGGGAQHLPITTGGGYLSSSSPPGPVSVTPVGGSSLVTSLVLGGSFPAAQTLQLISPHPQTHPPILRPTSSSLAPQHKPLAQVQYVLPPDGPSSPQLTHQHVLPLPTCGAQPGGGIRVSPGTRGETGSDARLTDRSRSVSSQRFHRIIP